MQTLVSSGNSAVTATEAGEWVPLLEVPGHTIINFIVVHNEGDFPGMWRIIREDGNDWTPPARLARGTGEPGERQAVMTIPCPGLSGARLEVMKPLLGGDLTGLWAWGMK